MSVREHDEQIITELQQLRKSSEKVKVSREVADFIEGYEEHVNGSANWKDNLIAEHSRSWLNCFEGLKDEAECMRGITPFELAVILINGYEVEQTPEEKLSEFYRGRVNSPNDYEREYAYGIEFTLRSLGIKIKGVNE